MESRTSKSDASAVQDVLRDLLVTKGFDGFSFDTGFRLRFTGDDARKRPNALELHVEGEWWFGSKEEWALVVQRMSPAGAAQPDEPVQAYHLALLRWSEGSEIASVILSPESLQVVTKSGTVISFSCRTAGSDFAWWFEEPGVPESEAQWLVSCTCDGEFYVRRP